MVVRPAYSRRSSGDIREYLKSDWTSTPEMMLSLDGFVKAEEEGFVRNGGGFAARCPTTWNNVSVFQK